MTDLPFKVDAWVPDDSAIEQTLAEATNLTIARAAFRGAVAAYPDKRLTLRHLAHVIEQHP